MRSRWLRRGAAVAGLIAAAALLRFTVFRADAVPVTVFRVSKGHVEDTVTNSKAGTVKSHRRASLSPEIGGRVERLPVRKGERVGTGQVLLELAQADLRAQASLQERSLEAARAGEREACESARQVARDLERYSALARDRVVSQQVLDGARTQRDVAAAACDAARARVLQSEAALTLARVNLGKTVLRAPFDGVVAEVRTELGEWITPSPPGIPIPPVIELIDPEAVYVSAPMDEVDAGKVRAGQLARVTMDAYPGRAFPGRVTRVAPYVLDVQEQNRTFEVEVVLDDDAFARTLLPGSSADVEVVRDARDDVLRVPAYALLEGGKVLAVRDGVLAAIPVTTGLSNWEFAEIRSGLSGGELVVVSLDRAEVKEGARARVAGETLR